MARTKQCARVYGDLAEQWRRRVQPAPRPAPVVTAGGAGPSVLGQTGPPIATPNAASAPQQASNLVMPPIQPSTAQPGGRSPRMRVVGPTPPVVPRGRHIAARPPLARQPARGLARQPARGAARAATVVPQPAPRRRRRKPGVRALHEIRKYQRTTDLLIRRLPFSRLVNMTLLITSDRFTPLSCY